MVVLKCGIITSESKIMDFGGALVKHPQTDSFTDWSRQKSMSCENPGATMVFKNTSANKTSDKFKDC